METQVFGASFPSDGQQVSGVGAGRPQPVHPRHLHPHRPHERSQLWQVSISALTLHKLALAISILKLACPCYRPPVDSIFSFKIFHRYHNQSAFFTNKEAGGTRQRSCFEKPQKKNRAKKLRQVVKQWLLPKILVWMLLWWNFHVWLVQISVRVCPITFQDLSVLSPFSSLFTRWIHE